MSALLPRDWPICTYRRRYIGTSRWSGGRKVALVGGGPGDKSGVWRGQGGVELHGGGSCGLGEWSLTVSNSFLSREPISSSTMLGRSDWVSMTGRRGAGTGWDPEGTRDPRSTHLSLYLQLTLVSQPKLGQHWLDASPSLGRPTGEGCLAGS